jgi:cytidine deaminase
MLTTNFDGLNKEEKILLEEAEKALQYAYNPYNSKTRVGAAIRTASGEIITGSNMCISSSSANICAERVTLSIASSRGERNIRSMAIIGIDGDGDIEKPIMPCGTCRQFIEEFVKMSGNDIQILCSNTKKDEIAKTSLNELLPFPYIGSGDTK